MLHLSTLILSPCSVWTGSSCKTCIYSLLIFFHQEKLAKSIHYLISKEDQVRSQITELEVLINQTEVRQLSHAAATPNTHHAAPKNVPAHFTELFLS